MGLPVILRTVLILLFGAATLACGESLTKDQYAQRCTELMEERPTAIEMKEFRGFIADLQGGHMYPKKVEDAEQLLATWRRTTSEFADLKAPGSLKLHHQASKDVNDLVDREYATPVEEAIPLAWEFLSNEPGSDLSLRIKALDSSEPFGRLVAAVNELVNTMKKASDEDRAVLARWGCFPGKDIVRR